MSRMLVALSAVCLPVLSVAAPPITEPVDVNVVNPVLPVEVSNAEPIAVVSAGSSSCATGNVALKSGLVAAPAPSGQYNVVSLTGAGTFVSAILTKQGGANDITSVELVLDGRNVTNLTFAALRNIGLTQSNPFGVAIFGDPTNPAGIDTVAIGFPCPVPFKTSLVLRVSVGSGDTGIAQITGQVIAGED